mgnify:CR=1 FL=1
MSSVARTKGCHFYTVNDRYRSRLQITDTLLQISIGTTVVLLLGIIKINFFSVIKVFSHLVLISHHTNLYYYYSILLVSHSPILKHTYIYIHINSLTTLHVDITNLILLFKSKQIDKFK